MIFINWLFDQIYGWWITFFPPKEVPEDKEKEDNG